MQGADEVSQARRLSRGWLFGRTLVFAYHHALGGVSISGSTQCHARSLEWAVDDEARERVSVVDHTRPFETHTRGGDERRGGRVTWSRRARAEPTDWITSSSLRTTRSRSFRWPSSFSRTRPRPRRRRLRGLGRLASHDDGVRRSLLYSTFRLAGVIPVALILSGAIFLRSPLTQSVISRHPQFETIPRPQPIDGAHLYRSGLEILFYITQK